MNVTAPGKLLALALVIVGCFAYLIVGAFQPGLETSPAWATLTLAVGYLVGNGTGAIRGQSTAPVFAPAPPAPRPDIGRRVELEHKGVAEMTDAELVEYRDLIKAEVSR